jgi:hypothetical protein
VDRRRNGDRSIDRTDRGLFLRAAAPGLNLRLCPLVASRRLGLSRNWMPAFVVIDNGGQKLAYIYFEKEAGWRSAAKLLTKDEARRIASTIAKLPEALRKVLISFRRVCRRISHRTPNDLARSVRAPRTLIRSLNVSRPVTGNSYDQHLHRALRTRRSRKGRRNFRLCGHLSLQRAAANRVRRPWRHHALRSSRRSG